MKIIPVTSANFSTIIATSIAVLKSGGVIAHPTDTVFGLTADANNPKAVAKIHAIKKTHEAKPLLLNLPSKVWLTKIGRQTCQAKFLAKKFWPGSLAFIILAKKGGTIGVRLPAHKISNVLARKFGSPLVTTSANLAGQKPAKSATQIMEIFRRKKTKPDLILDDNSYSRQLPSTLVDLTKTKPQLLRKGVIPFKKVLLVLSHQ